MMLNMCKNRDSYDDNSEVYSQRHDSETGLMYFKNRYYSVSMGQFVTRDPLGYVEGMSMYLGYFGGQNTDPFGLENTLKIVKVTVGNKIVFNKKHDCTVHLIVTHGSVSKEGKPPFTPVPPTDKACYGFIGCYVNQQNIGNDFPKFDDIVKLNSDKGRSAVTEAIKAAKKKAKKFDNVCCKFVKVIITYNLSTKGVLWDIGRNFGRGEFYNTISWLEDNGEHGITLERGGPINDITANQKNQKEVEVNGSPIKNENFDPNCKCD